MLHTHSTDELFSIPIKVAHKSSPELRKFFHVARSRRVLSYIGSLIITLVGFQLIFTTCSILYLTALIIPTDQDKTDIFFIFLTFFCRTCAHSVCATICGLLCSRVCRTYRIFPRVRLPGIFLIGFLVYLALS